MPWPGRSPSGWITSPTRGESSQRRVADDEPELLELLTDVLNLGDEVAWGIDLAEGGALRKLGGIGSGMSVGALRTSVPLQP